MPKFSYVAMDSRGLETKGVLDAIGLSEAIGRIKEMNFFPTKVSEVTAAKNAAAVRAHGKKGRGIAHINIVIPGLSGRVKTSTLTVFTWELATLLQAGLPLVRGLRILAKQEESANLKRVLGELAVTIEGGSTFSEALSQHPKVFNRLFINMVKAGEMGGVLELTLKRLADFMEKAQKIKGKVTAAMFYPCAVMGVAITIMGILMVFVIPKFKDIFENGLGNGRPLPAFTRIVLGISDTVKNHCLFALGVMAGVAITFNLLIRTSFGRKIYDRFKLRMPVLGPVVRKVAISRFARTLGTLVSSGVPILQALTVVKETAGNVIVGNAVTAIHNSVKEGETITAPLEAANIFPPMVISMVDVGEQTGALPEMLMKIADKYDDEVDNAVAAMTSLLEPIMIVFLAVIVGSIVIAMFLPIFTLIDGFEVKDKPGANERKSLAD